MRVFMWHKDQKAVSHCLTAIYSANGPDMNTDPSEILSLSLSLRERDRGFTTSIQPAWLMRTRLCWSHQRRVFSIGCRVLRCHG